ncbi:hypothetical protein SEUCBS139899_005787 [Sporothrix eucalyptigena]|uniref:Uncharacterized protein n=1 Tax=Sporothrix eucalyptigena TaxID=1812306 RepID=A0ABP0BNF8_9PEZI
MARIFITGSTDGIGLLTAKKLVADGHQVVLHARNQKRAAAAQAACPGAEMVLVGDLSNLAETKALAAAAKESGAFDCVIHNAGVYRGQDNAVSRDTGYPRLFVVNTLAPYVLAALIPLPSHLVFVSSSMHYGGRPKLDTMPRNVTYSDSKLHNVMLGKYFARHGKTQASSVDPGWVPTKLGGRSAPDSIEDSVKTYVMAALGTGAAATAPNGAYFVNSQKGRPQAVADDETLQDALVAKLAELSGVKVEK